MNQIHYGSLKSKRDLDCKREFTKDNGGRVDAKLKIDKDGQGSGNMSNQQKVLVQNRDKVPMKANSMEVLIDFIKFHSKMVEPSVLVDALRD